MTEPTFEQNIIDDLYTVVITDAKWPRDFPVDHQLTILKTMLDFYKSSSQFEKCGEISKLIKSIKDGV